MTSQQCLHVLTNLKRQCRNKAVKDEKKCFRHLKPKSKITQSLISPQIPPSPCFWYHYKNDYYGFRSQGFFLFSDGILKFYFLNGAKQHEKYIEAIGKGKENLNKVFHYCLSKARKKGKCPKSAIQENQKYLEKFFKQKPMKGLKDTTKKIEKTDRQQRWISWVENGKITKLWQESYKNSLKPRSSMQDIVQLMQRIHANTPLRRGLFLVNYPK